MVSKERAILASRMPKSRTSFSFFFSPCISRVPTILIPSSVDSSHWSFYVYVCYEDGSRIGRELDPTFVGIGWLHLGSRVARETGGQRRNRVDYETRSVHFGHRLRSCAAGNFATCKLDEVYVIIRERRVRWRRPIPSVVRHATSGVSDENSPFHPRAINISLARENFVMSLNSDSVDNWNRPTGEKRNHGAVYQSVVTG